jgi:two-component system, sensor histidine kinase
VDIHNRTVHISSEGPGTATPFAVKLPIECNPNEAQHGLNEKNSANDRNLRVLLVDDNIDAVNLLGMVLRQIGYEVRIANDGASALTLAPEFVPHVVFMDIGLPGMNGYEAAKELQKIPALEKTTLVALTGYGQEKDREKAFATGFNHHFVKPVEVHAIDNFLRRVEPF